MTRHLEIRVYGEPVVLLAETGSFLMQNEALNNLLLEIPVAIESRRRYCDETPIFVAARLGGECVRTLM